MKKWEERLEKMNDYDKEYLITGIEDGWIDPNMDDWHIYCKLKGIDEHQILTWLKKIVGVFGRKRGIDMREVELVIKIPEEIYSRYMNYTESYVDFIFFGTEEKIVRAIRNGTPLPKGHGDLIDKNELLTITDCMEDGTERCYVPYEQILDAPTIIEADKGES